MCITMLTITVRGLLVTSSMLLRRSAEDQQGLLDEGIVVPTATDTKTKKRTDIKLNLIDRQLPRTSLISLKNVACVVVDGLHSMLRYLLHSLKEK
jgi:hypothetical protein